MNPTRCDVLIIGSGPAGLFAADQLRDAGIADVLIVEKGRPMARRACPPGPGCDCRTCDVLEGEGGAGSFSDGKITLSPTRGTHGAALFTTSQERLLAVVDTVVRRFAPAGIDYPPVAALDALAGPAAARLRFEAYPLLHVGSDGIREFGHNYATHLQESGVRFLTGVEATALHVSHGRAIGAQLTRRAGRDDTQTWTVACDAVIVASGMMGTPWLEQQLHDLGVALETGPADLGIRVETTAASLAPFIDQFYDFKIHYTSPAGLTVRSFCVNGDGYVVNEYHRSLGIRGVNGHSFLSRRSGQSNLAVLATVEPSFVADPKRYVRDTARAVNAGADGYPIGQPLAEFMPGRTTAPNGVSVSNPKVRPGSLRTLLPGPLYDAFTGYLGALGEALPPVLGADTVVYAPEIKYYNYRVPVDPGTWQCRDIPGLYVVGNAAGYTASLSAAALSGIIAGRAITTGAAMTATATATA